MNFSNLLFSSHLEKGEKIAYIAHTHIFTAIKPLSKVLFFWLILPISFYFIFPPLKILWLIWSGVGILKLFYATADWYFDAWLITNLGIIDIKWDGIFNKSSTRIEFNTLKGVSYSINGFWGTILNFGDIQVEGFITNTIVSLEKAYKPKKIERAILRNQEKFLANKSFAEHESIKDMLTTLLEKEAAKRA